MMFKTGISASLWKSARSAGLCGAVLISITACIAEPAQVASAPPAATPASAAKPGTENVTFVLTSDVYKMAPENGRGGLARIVSVLKAEKASRPHVVSVHAGDTISPSLMSGFDKGAHIVDLFNMSPLDVFVPGNHEFDFGPEIFALQMGKLKARVLAANLAGADGKPLPGIAASHLYLFGDVKIGVIGLTDENSPISSKPGSLRFADSLSSGSRVAAELRAQGADLIVVVAHAGRDRDEMLFEAGFADLILSGHDHDLYMRFNEKTAIIEAGEDGMAVAAVDVKVSIDVKGDGRRQVRWWPNFRFIDTADAVPDAEVEKRVAHFESRLNRDLEVPVAQTLTALDSRNAAVRGGEAVIGNLFADVIREATQTDIALLNGGAFRGGKVYEPGHMLTRKDILTELPFLNKTYVLEISGSDLLQAIEEGFVGAENEVGRFPQVSGLSIKADLTKPHGLRVISLRVGGKPLSKSKLYRLATNDYLANGGDGYKSLKRARVIVGETEGALITSLVISQLEARKKVSPRLDGRIMASRARPAR